MLMLLRLESCIRKGEIFVFVVVFELGISFARRLTLGASGLFNRVPIYLLGWLVSGSPCRELGAYHLRPIPH